MSDSPIANSNQSDNSYFKPPMTTLDFDYLTKKLDKTGFNYVGFTHESDISFSQTAKQMGMEIYKIDNNLSLLAESPGEKLPLKYYCLEKERKIGTVEFEAHTGLIKIAFKPPINELAIKKLVSLAQKIRPDKNADTPKFCIYQGLEMSNLILNLYTISRLKGYESQVANPEKIFKNDPAQKDLYESYQQLGRQEFMTMIEIEAKKIREQTSDLDLDLSPTPNSPQSSNKN